MATEAQKLISVSLGKIANSRMQRGGMSLHKNLLVANVLQRARAAFMEETFHLMNSYKVQDRVYTEMDCQGSSESNVVDYHSSFSHSPAYSNSPTPYYTVSMPESCDSYSEPTNSENIVTIESDLECNDEDDKENVSVREDADADLDSTERNCDDRLREALVDADSRLNGSWPPSRCLKRRRTINEEAVSSILPKRVKREPYYCEYDYSTVSNTNHSQTELRGDTDNSMDVEQITSLVTIFSSSFTGLISKSESKLTRSLSTPDLCCKSVKESFDVLNMPVLAMTV
uniref:EGR2 n=1 Tax=Hemiscolopendra marginata TaxID=943146 RepID=A0A646QFQ5_9MYRI